MTPAMMVWIEAPFDNLPAEGYRKQRYWLMAEAFVRAGHAVVYWTSDFSHATKRARVLSRTPPASEASSSFRTVLVPTRPYAENVGLRRVSSHRAYAREWERMAVRELDSGGTCPDFIVVATPPVATAAAALRLRRRTGARLVVDIQDAWPETFYRLLPRGLRWIGRFVLAPMRAAVRRLYREADLVTGVCDRYGALAHAAGAGEFYRAYHGIECPPCRARELPKDVLRLVYVGNLGRSYDLTTVVEGVRRLRAEGADVTLDVAGFGEASGLRGAGVSFHGLLDRAALADLLARCDVGVIPLRADSFVGLPYKLGEYAAAGLRVVSSLAGETAALLEHYGCGVTYRPGDAASFVAAVERVRTGLVVSSSVLLERELDARVIYDGYVRRVSGIGRRAGAAAG